MKRMVTVWDVPTRVFHWGLVGLFCVMWLSGKTGGEWLQLHIWCGEVLATLLLFRVLWGLFGSQTARFSDFLKGPNTIRRYLAGDLKESVQPGHNPLGGWMVLILLVVLLFQATTGLFSSDVDSYLYDAPLAHLVSSSLSESLTAVHKLTFNLILTLAALHVLAIVAYRVFKKQNLVRAMLSGRKEIDGEVAPLRMASLRLAFACLLLAAGVMATLVLVLARN